MEYGEEGDENITGPQGNIVTVVVMVTTSMVLVKQRRVECSCGLSSLAILQAYSEIVQALNRLP